MAVFVGEQAITPCAAVIGARSDSVTRVETGPMMASTLSPVTSCSRATAAFAGSPVSSAEIEHDLLAVDAARVVDLLHGQPDAREQRWAEGRPVAGGGEQRADAQLAVDVAARRVVVVEAGSVERVRGDRRAAGGARGGDERQERRRAGVTVEESGT